MCLSILNILAHRSSKLLYKCACLQMRRNDEWDFLKEILNDYFKDYELFSSVREGEFYVVVNSNLDSAEDIVELVDIWKIYVRNQQNLEIKL